MPTKEKAFNKIQSLVQRFDEQKEFYKDKEYNETQTRRDFIDPFWKALGWDMDNENGYAESYREVIHEDRVQVSGATKAPDYSFRLPGGKRLFFLEAKKPSTVIRADILPAYQIRRYDWSAKMPVSVVTDFEEFAVYDCSNKPHPTDQASVGRIKYLTYNNYVREFDFLWNTFSKESVLKGGFDKYVQSDVGKKGTTTVDRDFLASLDKWRVELARNIALRNTEIGEDELNFAVHNTIDRIVFLRIAEDRGVERYGELRDSIQSNEYYQNLLRRFHVADEKYNSGLFDFRKDSVTPRITIDNKVLKSIIAELYYPVCPYEFSVLPVEILGCAYEQFLGKQITLSKGGRAAIEEKPEVRKAGGVYYTPQYIVDYIVENTVGKLLENKTPKEAGSITIVDPACGSGSFLIGAYQYLLNWHKDYYTQHGKPGKGRKGDVLTPAGELTTAEKKRILINNIFGVDLDGNAVEVTKLSLLLKCMEGETKESIEVQRKLFHDRVLPMLDDNIKCGNSLVDLDYYENQLDFGEERKVKPFSWQKNFPGVFKQGGFDCVIGNPPYVNAKVLVELFNNVRQYLAKSYKFLYQKWDLYVAFIERALSLLKKNGLNSMIIPYPFINQIYGKVLRTHIIKNHKLISVLDLSNVKVFKDAVVTNIVYCVEKFGATDKVSLFKIKDNKVIYRHRKASKQRILRKDDENSNWNLTTNTSVKLDKSKYYTFGDICFISIGMVLNADEKTANGEFVKSDLINTRKTRIHKKQYIEAKDIDRFRINKIRYLEWGTSRVPGKIRRPTFIELYENPKLLINKLGKLKATFDNSNTFCDQTIRIGILWMNLKSVQNNSINNSVKKYSDKTRTELENISKLYNEKFLLGILNSKTGHYFLDSIRGMNNIDINPDYLKSIPVPKIDLTNKTQKRLHDEIIKNVDLLLQLNKDLQTASFPSRREQLQSRIGYCEDKLNAVVYELYGLTEDEIAIIEGEERAK